MALGFPGLDGVIRATENMPEQFEALVQRLDRVVELLEAQNDLINTKMVAHTKAIPSKEK